MSVFKDSGASLQYVGGATTARCVQAIVALLQGGVVTARADILTADHDHGLLLTTEEEGQIAVKPGFRSGYPGEGPRGLSYVISLLLAHGTEIEEYRVTRSFLARLERTALRESDLCALNPEMPLRPQRWQDYLLDVHRNEARQNGLWKAFPPVVPFALIDPRLMDLTLGFWNDPDARLGRAYRRLEDVLRVRIQSPGYGARLFDQAFFGNPPKLAWRGLRSAETAARVELFKSVFRAFRNPRAHGQLSDNPAAQLSELLMVNELFRLEREATGPTTTGEHDKPAGLPERPGET